MVMELEKFVSKPRSIDLEIPIGTDLEITATISQKIEYISNEIQKPFRAHAQYPITLINLTTEEFTHTTTFGDIPKHFKVERERGQNIVIAQMQRWGFDENKFDDKIADDLFSSEVKIEERKYPTDLRGMFFHRLRSYYRGSPNATFEVKWTVVPEVAMFKFNPIEALTKKKHIGPHW